ncbi:VanZ family protein [Pullulanibacillus sp. KACC 23026]|uniref:VanZ family protein n=1 Tax=Pullulanibacillus sp. KACC 23026 TaxID=3028315 RepID=UPI0023B1B5C6|nr:VanZ family protein [Pullulanibacillus sp. KACC 23026]WEG14523.1 VanZ family protein [Pullulanibacillus sp. KACC 23026]
MKKYVFLFFPIIYYGFIALQYLDLNKFYSLSDLFNMVIATSCLFFLLKHIKLNTLSDWIVGGAFSLYICVLYHLTVEFVFDFSDMEFSMQNVRYLSHSVNLIPLKGIFEVINNSPSAFYQIIGNIGMLAPFSFSMLYLQGVKSSKQAIVISVACSLGIEVIQFLQSLLVALFLDYMGMGRISDIDDVILNTTGAVIGVACYHFFTKMGKIFLSEERATKKIGF